MGDIEEIEVSQILPKQYLEFLRGLKKSFASDVYLYGGWLLSAICRKPYFGDLDIAVNLRQSVVCRELQNLGLRYELNLHDSLRLPISDGNFLDINSLSDATECLTIEEFLAQKTFTVYGCAIEIDADRIICTSEFIADFSRRQFSVGSKANLSHQRPLSVLRNWHALKDYYAFNFDDSNSNILDHIQSLRLAWPCSKANSAIDTLHALRTIIEPYLPSGREIYTAKGAIRSSLLNCFDIWDDVDIIIIAEFQTVIDHLKSTGASYALNYYGNPKLFLPLGQSVDIIPLPSPDKLCPTLQGFFHGCDQVLWCWGDNEIYDPHGVLSDVRDRIIRFPSSIVTKYSEADLAYFSLKSVYLIIRHEMKPDIEMSRYINSPRIFTAHHHRLTVGMLKELASAINPIDLVAALRALDTDMPSSAVTNFVQYLDISHWIRTEEGGRRCISSS